jgi:SAM-dependent methyltransferase
MTGSILKILLAGRETSLAPGALVGVEPAEHFRNGFDSLLATVLADITAGEPWRDAANRRLAATHPWFLRTLTDPSRARWLELHPPARDSWVLDVGCSCGQWAVPAATQARVVALEPNPLRLAVARAIARQESRIDSIYFVGSPLEAADFSGHKFDSIYCIGVLEWAPRYQPGADPVAAQENVLRRLHGLLADQGECVIGIENRLGLKYLLGANDDHTGLPGISCLDAEMAARRYLERTGQELRVFTHSLQEYQQLLNRSGFGAVEFFAAYPDYKVPQTILAVGDATNRHCLTGEFVLEHDGSNGSLLPFQSDLASHYRSLAQLGVAGLFAPSFFIRARR